MEQHEDKQTRPSWAEPRDTHWSQARPGTETSPQRGQHYYTCVKSVRSLCRIDMSLYQHKSTHCHFQQISGFVDGGGISKCLIPGPRIAFPRPWLHLTLAECRLGARAGVWCGVDIILSEECKQIHNMPITTPGLDETREDNCWDEWGLGNTGTWWAAWPVQGGGNEWENWWFGTQFVLVVNIPKTSPTRLIEGRNLTWDTRGRIEMSCT